MSSDVIALIENSPRMSTDFAEKFVMDMIGQLEVIDPTEDSEEILKIFRSLVEEQNLHIFSFLLGTSPEDFLEDYLDGQED